MDKETIRPNQKAIRRFLNVAMNLNAADLINGGYVKMKNELTHFLRQVSFWRHRMMKQKLQSSDSLRVEQEIARRLLATVKIKPAELNEGNLKVIKKVLREIQSVKGKILIAKDDIMKKIIKIYSTLYQNDLCNEKAKEDVLNTSERRSQKMSVKNGVSRSQSRKKQKR